jgi:hypothetical protein
MSSSPGFGKLRWDPPPPYGVSALPHHALPPDRGVLSTSPPIAAITVELHLNRSCPCGLIYFGEPRWSSCPSSMVPAVSSTSSRRLDGCCNPDVAAMLCSVARPWAWCRPLTGAASGQWPWCHNRGCAIVSPPWSSVLLPCEHSCEFFSSLLLCACYGGLASKPGMLVYAVAVPCCCCCSAQACAASLWILLLWVLVQVLVQDSVENFLIWTWYDYLGISPCAVSLTMCCVLMATVSMKFS